MANSLCEISLTEVPLATPVRSEQSCAGAIVDFWGVVRRIEDGSQIEGIDYEAHGAMAEYQLRLIAKEAASKFALKQIIIHHRVGFVPVGDASLFLRVTAERRAAAFAASEWVVDELKHRVPIWKRPKFKIDNQPGPRSVTALQLGK